MRFISTAILLVWLGSSLFAQPMKIEAGAGLGTYSMKDLKQLNNLVLEDLPVEAKITDDFPATLSWRAGIIPFSYKAASFGMTGSYQSTGSRINYIDYSGEYKLDQVISSYDLSLLIRFKLKESRLNLYETNYLSYAFTRLKISEMVLEESSEYKFKSGSLQYEPCLNLGYAFHSFEFLANLGYVIDLGGKLVSKDGDDMKLINPETNKRMKSNWSGFRFGLSIGWIFNRRSPNLIVRQNI
jgi:hypothetical protein